MEVDRSAEGNYSTELYGAKAAQIIRWEKYVRLGDHMTNQVGEMNQVARPQNDVIIRAHNQDHNKPLLSGLTTKSNLSSSIFPFKLFTTHCKFQKSESTFNLWQSVSELHGQIGFQEMFILVCYAMKPKV